MSKKLLSEAQVRRFQSLANIEPLVEMYNEEEANEEAALEEAEESVNEEVVTEEETLEEAEMEMDAGEMEMDNAEEADVELDEELVQKFMDAVDTIQQVASALDVGAEEAAEEEVEAEIEMDAEEAPMEMDAEEAPAEEEEIALQEALEGINYVPSQKEIVKVVAQRVAKRLQEAKEAQARLDKALGKK